MGLKINALLYESRYWCTLKPLKYSTASVAWSVLKMVQHSNLLLIKSLSSNKDSFSLVTVRRDLLLTSLSSNNTPGKRKGILYENSLRII